MSTATATQSGMRIVPYTPKSFAVIGDTYPHRDQLKEMGGAFSKWLKMDGQSVPGWCFSLKREVQVRQWLMQVGSPRLAPIDKKAKPKSTKPKSKAKPKGKVNVLEGMLEAYLDKYLKKADSIAFKTEPKVLAEKIDTPCSKERIARALAGEPVSGYHWAMRHVLEWGLQPSEVGKGTGLFGYDRHGNPFGEKERRAAFWMLNSKSSSADIACAEECPEHLRSNVSEQTLWDIVTDFSGPGGKSRLVEKCLELSEGSVILPDCPF